MTNARDTMLNIDQDKIAVRKSIDFLLHLLHDFIPEGCFRDAERRLYETFEKEGMELTTRMMRKQYEAWKSTQIDILNTIPPKFPS
jgi:hypothetical protein